VIWRSEEVDQLQRCDDVARPRLGDIEAGEQPPALDAEEV
jgi:hypothetical protein